MLKFSLSVHKEPFVELGWKIRHYVEITMRFSIRSSFFLLWLDKLFKHYQEKRGRSTMAKLKSFGFGVRRTSFLSRSQGTHPPTEPKS